MEAPVEMPGLLSRFSLMHVLAARATSLPAWSLTSHSTYPRVLPALTTLASAVRVAFRTARR